MQLEEVLSLLPLPIDDILNIYVIGSRVYGTHTEASDFDFMIVVSNTAQLPEPCITEHGEWISHEEDGDNMSFKAYKTDSTVRQMMMYRSDNIDMTLYTVDMFQYALDRCIVSFLECVSLKYIKDESLRNSVLLLEKHDFIPPGFLKQDENNKLTVLRRSISGEVDHSFVKAKKKVINEHKILQGRKALFHSLRVALFGLQIAKHGYIVDFSEANGLYQTVVFADPMLDDPNEEWERLRKKLKPQLSQIQIEFRKFCPKN
jgi:hypothetical protein